ncbi:MULTISPECIES: hypothetical protein [Escherichia]
MKHSKGYVLEAQDD